MTISNGLKFTEENILGNINRSYIANCVLNESIGESVPLVKRIDRVFCMHNCRIAKPGDKHQ